MQFATFRVQQIHQSTRIQFKTCRRGNQLICRFVFKINSEFITFVQKRTTFFQWIIFLCQSLVLNSFNESGMTCLVEVIYNTTKNKPSPDLTPHGAGAVSFCSGLPRLGSVLIHVCLREIRNKYALITDSNRTNKEYLSSFGSDPPQVNLTSISKPYQSRRQISYLT